jgi:hypothetical protein
MLVLAVVVAALLLGVEATRSATSANSVPVPARWTEPCPNPSPVPHELTLPASVPPGEPTAIERTMLAYLSTYKYQKLGWCVDKYVRDTGPFVHGQYYGTHPAVRIYYSPEVMRWLRNGRHGVPDEGAVIIKEQYGPGPAARYAALPEGSLRPTDWTVMIRRSSASRDGWFWAEVYTPGMSFGGVQYPNAGFGLYCLRCHASANDAATFASLSNIKGFPGEPLTFKIDDTWRTPPPWVTPAPAPVQINEEHQKNAIHPALVSHHHLLSSLVRPFPPEPLDGNLSNPSPKPAPQFLTSDQCMSCHSAASGPATGPTMWLTPPPNWTPPPSPMPSPWGVNVSPYGEWRWSPMGLAGRDPIFFSQLEGELAFIDRIPAHRIAGHDPAATRKILKQQVTDTCMRCHGVMGKRTNDIENGRNAHFNLNWVFQHAPVSAHDNGFRYGGLARDGISCTVCHHITQTPEEQKSLAFVLETKSTGLFTVGPPDKLHGPFKDTIPAHPLNPALGIAVHPMNEALGAKPVFSALTKSARLCTTCHSINLPVVDSPAKIHPITPTMTHDVEQNTYVEWVNSRFQTEYKPLPGAQSCQACHMSIKVDNERLNVRQPLIQTQIAIVQDQTYPAAEHRAPIDTITVRYREGRYASGNAGPRQVDRNDFHRHELLGLNAFLLRAFQQNSDVLGVRLNDYMSGSATDLPDAIGNVVHQARTATANVGLNVRVENGLLVADVEILNKAGHRFPSGVGFRRAFVELKVTDPDGKLVWASGTTNANGEIVDATDMKVLPTEYFARGADGKQRYQPHFDEAHAITSQDQVQIFEELVKDADDDLTFSFIRRDHHVKDNRLLPQGWRKDGVPGIKLPENWLEATHPEGAYVSTDPRYADGKGKAVVRYRIAPPTALDPSRLHVEATLWYQAWEPAFKRERTSGGIAASTLRALLDNMALETTSMANWKLKIASARWPAN